MISATGNRRTVPVSRAFSLIEIVLVLGLLALVASVVLVNFTAMIDRGKSRSAEDVLRHAIREARFKAAASRQITSLTFDAESGALALSGPDGDELDRFPLGPDFRDRATPPVRFFVVPPEVGLRSFDRAFDTRLEADRIHFAPDRSSTPFVVELDTGSGSPSRLPFDPFSSLPLAPE